MAVAPLIVQMEAATKELLPYACLAGVVCAGILLSYTFAGIIKLVGTNKVMRLSSRLVVNVGPIIAVIGLGLCLFRAHFNCSNNWWLAIVALGLVIIFNIFGCTVRRRFFPYSFRTSRGGYCCCCSGIDNGSKYHC